MIAIPQRSETAIKINKLGKLIMTDTRVEWAGVCITDTGLKLGIYYLGDMSVSELQGVVTSLGGPVLQSLLSEPGFAARKVSPRVIKR